MKRVLLAILSLVALSGCAPARPIDEQQMAQANTAADLNSLKSKQQETRMRLEELEGRLGERGDAGTLQDMNQRISRLEETVARIAATLGVDAGARAPSPAPAGVPGGAPAVAPTGAYPASSGAASGAYAATPAPATNPAYRANDPMRFELEDEDRPPNLPPLTGRTPAAQPSGAPTSTDPAEAVYNMGMESFNQRDYDRANTLFAELLKSYPNARQAPNALFWQAEANFQQGDFARAALLCQDLLQKYPSSPMAPAAMLKQGLAFRRLNKAQAAKILFQDVVQRYPNSPEAKSAQIQLRDLK